jgi:hypothetical protein
MLRVCFTNMYHMYIHTNVIIINYNNITGIYHWCEAFWGFAVQTCMSWCHPTLSLTVFNVTLNMAYIAAITLTFLVTVFITCHHIHFTRQKVHHLLSQYQNIFFGHYGHIFHTFIKLPILQENIQKRKNGQNLYSINVWAQMWIYHIRKQWTV